MREKPRLTLSNKIGFTVGVILVLLLITLIINSQRSISTIEANEREVFKQRLESIVDLTFSQWASTQESIALLVAESKQVQALLSANDKQIPALREAVLEARRSLFFRDVDSIIVRSPRLRDDIVFGDQSLAKQVSALMQLKPITSPVSTIYCTSESRCHLVSAIPVLVKTTKQDAILITIADLDRFFANMAKAAKLRISVGRGSNDSDELKLDVSSVQLPDNYSLLLSGFQEDVVSSTVKYNIRYLTITGIIAMAIAIMLIYLFVLSKAKQIREVTEAMNQYREGGMQKLMRRLVKRNSLLFADEIDDLYRGMLDMSVEIEKNNMAKAQKIEAELRADNEEKWRVQKEKMLAKFARAAEHERAHLAAELHDDIGQQIVKIRIDASMIKSISNGRLKTIEKLESIEKACREIHDSIRGIIDELHPHDIETLGFEKAINELVNAWKIRLPSVQFETHVSGDVENLPRAIKTCLYRCAQEALTNIAKYAKPKTVVVSLEADTKVASIHVHDDGLGFNPMVKMVEGRGLRGMKDRVESLSGAFLIRSSRGNGTHIRAHIPIYRDDADDKKRDVNLSQ